MRNLAVPGGRVVRGSLRLLPEGAPLSETSRPLLPYLGCSLIYLRQMTREKRSNNIISPPSVVIFTHLF